MLYSFLVKTPVQLQPFGAIVAPSLKQISSSSIGRNELLSQQQLLLKHSSLFEVINTTIRPVTSSILFSGSSSSS
eukprot:19215-Heterococcus_DN1.PRE.3